MGSRWLTNCQQLALEDLSQILSHHISGGSILNYKFSKAIAATAAPPVVRLPSPMAMAATTALASPRATQFSSRSLEIRQGRGKARSQGISGFPRSVLSVCCRADGCDNRRREETEGTVCSLRLLSYPARLRAVAATTTAPHRPRAAAERRARPVAPRRSEGTCRRAAAAAAVAAGGGGSTSRFAAASSGSGSGGSGSGGSSFVTLNPLIDDLLYEHQLQIEVVSNPCPMRYCMLVKVLLSKLCRV